MNIALIGYGNMGKEIERAARERGFQIVHIFNTKNNAEAKGLTASNLKTVDVCIDFSHPATVLRNIEAVITAGKNLVVGTTGWHDRLDHVTALVKKHHTGFLHAANFSLGINIFSRIVQAASHVFNHYPDYDISVSETHHRGKADSPSGTALTLAGLVLHEVKRKSSLLTETAHGTIKSDQLHVSSSRIGHVTGKHSVTFDSDADTIELTHTAKSRHSYAVGALVAAEWLKGKKGVYTMKDVIQ